MITVTVPAWTWTLPVAVVYLGGLGYGAWTIVDLGIRRAEFWALKRWGGQQ